MVVMARSTSTMDIGVKYDFKVNLTEKNNSQTALIDRIKEGERILELGCATGYISQVLKQQLNCYVVGVELDPLAAKRAEEHCNEVLCVDLDVDDIVPLLEQQTFDVILCADVLEHLRDPVKVLSRLRKTLNPGGRLLASIPNVAHASIRLELLQGHFDYEKLGLLDETHLHFYTRNSIINTLVQAGYVCYDISYTFHDMADESISEHLAKMGLQPTQETFELLHHEDAQAYQFVLEARPAHPDIVSKLHISPIELKPLASSKHHYGQKQQEIETLKQQAIQLQEQDKHRHLHIKKLEEQDQHRQEHIKQLEEHVQQLAKDIELLQAQNNELNHTCSETDQRLFQLTEESIDTHQNYQDLNGKFQFVLDQKDSLEAVLSRIHDKLSYRIFKAARRSIGAVVRFPLKLKPGKKTHQKKPVRDPDVNDYQRWIEKYDGMNKQFLQSIEQDQTTMQNGPIIALLMPVYNTNEQQLHAAMQSILKQVYPRWQLCIADDASEANHIKRILEKYAKNDSRIKVVFREANGHISQASNTALELVEAEYVGLFDHDDELSPDALYQVAKAIVKNPDVKMIYSDEDKLDQRNKRFAPYFKPDWNPELLLSHNYVCHLGVYKTDLIRDIGGFRTGYEGAQDYDLTLRYVERIEEQDIEHIPHVLYHWRAAPGSTAQGIEQKPYAEKMIRKVVQEAMQRRGIDAKVLTHQYLPGALRVLYPVGEKPLVSIIIPTRNGFRLIKRCLESILSKTDYQHYEIIVVDNGSDDVVLLRYLAYLEQEGNLTVLRDDRPFNYAGLNNRAAAAAQGELIALLNNDLEVINSDWLTEMVGLALRPQNGAVGAKLWYPNDTIQHGGVITGLGGVAGHSHKHSPKGYRGFMGRLELTQNLSAVTAACLVLRKSIYDEVGGFDEEHLSVAFNDVDLCLRIIEAGYKNVWTPYAELYHYESATRGYEDTPEKQARFAEEIDYMQARWGDQLMQNDPAYNPNLTLDREDFSLAWPPRVPR